MKEDRKHSLIKADGDQLDLISSADMPADVFKSDELEGTPEFTGERLFKQDPEKYRLIVSLVAEGLGVIRIGKLLRVSPNTVRAVRDREPTAIDIEKQRLAGKMRTGASMCVDGILEDLDDDERRRKISARDKSIIAGVLVDKSQLLVGDPTAIVDKHIEAKPEHDDFDAYLDKLRREAGVIDAECQETQLTGGTDDPKGALPLAVPGADSTGSASVPAGQELDRSGFGSQLSPAAPDDLSDTGGQKREE